MKVGDKVLINKCSLKSYNGLTGVISDIDTYEGDLEIMVKTDTRTVLVHDGEFEVIDETR